MTWSSKLNVEYTFLRPNKTLALGRLRDIVHTTYSEKGVAQEPLFTVPANVLAGYRADADVVINSTLREGRHRDWPTSPIIPCKGNLGVRVARDCAKREHTYNALMRYTRTLPQYGRLLVHRRARDLRIQGGDLVLRPKPARSFKLLLLLSSQIQTKTDMIEAPVSMYVVNGAEVIDVLPTKTLPPARDPTKEPKKTCAISRVSCQRVTSTHNILCPQLRMSRTQCRLSRQRITSLLTGIILESAIEETRSQAS